LLFGWLLRNYNSEGLRAMSAKRTVLLAACILGSVSFGTGMVGSTNSASAQDLLPRDNGIFTYHTSPRWRESEDHPLRTVAYILHPVGWILREGIYRPFSAFAGSTRFTKSFFGFREPFDFREPLCFFDTDKVPDCHSLPPYNAIGVDHPKSTEPEDETASLNTERQVYFPDIAFDFNKSSLNDLGKARVRQVAQLLASVPSLKVVVEGHTDYIGTDEYNMKLGQRRADTVVKELSELGVDTQRMTPVSFGEGKPLFTEEEDWARAANRRVQFSVQGEGQPAPAAASSEAKTDLPPAATK
jgi:outer membrane protein OmpA-like peptidoglycan-associated protein